MSIARVYTAQPGVQSGDIVTIETDISRGLHSFSIVGLAGKAVEEAKDRVGAAIKNSGYKSPKSQNQKITVSLAPADLRKDGPLFDLPIAISYLIANGELKIKLEDTVLLGELGLDGQLHAVKGVLPAVWFAYQSGFTTAIVPVENVEEASLIEGMTIYGAKDLRSVILHLDKNHPDHQPLRASETVDLNSHWLESEVNLEDIKGQESAKRGLLIAAAGRHNVVLAGPPGTGKTMLARAFRGLLPPLSIKDALEVLAIHSLSGEFKEVSSGPPFRSPHHTASYTALVGGGTNPKPGEVTLAHKGVLFMDEFPEFDRRCLDALRQPLEDKVVTISRVSKTALFPADFILLAALNPYRGVEDGSTDYASTMMHTYKNKISGPILDRIDLWLSVPHISYETLTNIRSDKKDETKIAREKILKARERQLQRLKERNLTTNSAMTARDVEDFIEIDSQTKELLKQSAVKLNLSPRSYHRLLKVTRTIADLDDQDNINQSHLLEALQYRVKL